jgi:hypothetical protein
MKEIFYIIKFIMKLLSKSHISEVGQLFGIVMLEGVNGKGGMCSPTKFSIIPTHLFQKTFNLKEI